MSRILVVDDEPAICATLEGLLAREGRELVVARDGREALELACEGAPFDVALVDKNLPDRTGIEVGRELRERCPETEILLMTGYPSFDSAVEALRLGACGTCRSPSSTSRSWTRRSSAPARGRARGASSTTSPGASATASSASRR